MSPASIAPSSSSTPKGISSSSSQPTLTKSTSQSSLTSPTKPSTPSSKNYHPYLIHSSASSLLTRTNSSPAQPPSSPSHHRSSRSMSSLNYILEGAEKDKEKEDRRKSMESPRTKVRPGVRRSGTLPEFLNNGGQKKMESREIDLPMNPKSWTPSELAQYLGYTLRTGGPEGTGHVLPAPLVEDIKSWVLRQRVSGRDFLKGSSDGWGNTTRPPPFLPLLQTIARRLRRHSLSGRIESVPSNPDDSFGKGSILMEENEDEEDTVEDGITGVKRMANAFDAKSSTSSVSDSGASDEEEVVGKLKAQLTGESVSERWRAWEDKLDIERRRGRKVSDVSSMGSISEQEGYTSSAKSEVEEEEEDEDQAGVTIKAPPPSSQLNLAEGLTPPPPYTSSFPDNHRITIQALPTLVECLTPERRRDEGTFSVTPTPERASHASNAGLGIMTPSPDSTPSRLSSSQLPSGSGEGASPHMKNISNHSNPYAALRRRSSSGPKYPSVRNLNLAEVNTEEEEDEEEEGYLRPAQKSPASVNFAGEELDGSRWTTARRVTLRPSQVQSIFDETGSVSEGSSSMIVARPEEEKKTEMQDQMEVLMGRIKELEDKLEKVDRPVKKRTPGNDTKSMLSLLGLGSGADNEGDDGLPRRVRELPVYLFLVGFGVGAVVVRVLFGRSR
nr:hypothetical protein I302_02683 [Kwoniella bestiolae CBS 10118]OCF27834.1 hypothetical protein I302_02683 [Kwoniella bestiolae CBS 10118]